jgi:enamine deaminase RidA (YjgF/YER057c/UK114 family)
MHKVHNPAGIAGPVSPAYSHGIEVPPGARWLTISGQVGVTPDGKIAQGITAQADQAWKNIVAILKSAGMGLEDVVKVTTFLTSKDYIAGAREVRGRYQVEGYRPASTLLVVAGLASPDYLIEIEAVAAKA